MKKILYMLFAMGLIVSSCSKDIDTDFGGDGQVAASFVDATITRATDGVWAADDQIGIFAYDEADAIYESYENICYKASDGGESATFLPSSTTIFYPTSGDKLSFIAYSPYQASADDCIYDIDLSEQSAPEDIDLIVADDGVLYGNENPEVSLQLDHKLAKLTMTLKAGSGLTQDDLAGATVTLTDIAATGTYDLKDGTFTLSTDKQTITARTITAGSEYDVIIFPYALAVFDVEFYLPVTGKTYTWGLLGESFTSGQDHAYVVAIDESKISISAATLSGWGVNDNVELAATKPWDNTIATGFESGTGSSTDPYIIATGAQLAYLAQQVNSGTTYSGKYFKQANYINLNDYEWTPIGSNESPFSGTYDGGNFEVSKLYITIQSSSKGLFGYASGATIYNVGVTGSVTVSGSTSAISVGGIVGYAENALIINCYNKATVSGYYNVGGIAGYAEGSSIINCYSTSTNIADYSVGGIVGAIGSNTTITSCYSRTTSAVVEPGKGGYNGAVVGTVGGSNNTITLCYYDSSVYGSSNGGIGSGSSYGSTTGYSTTYMQSSTFVDVLNLAASTYNETALEIEAHGWKTVTGDYPTFDAEYVPTAPTDKGYTIDTDGTYLIYNADGLTTFATLVNSGSHSISAKLTDNIVLSGTWTPMVAGGSSSNGYSGTFDGDGHSITGLSVSGSEQGQGLFGTAVNATIKNLKVGGAVSNSASHAAIIAGKAWYTTFTDCEALEGSTVTGTSGDSFAGIVGYSYQCKLTSCINQANITGVTLAAGITGYTNDNASYSAITDCENYGTIIATATSDGYAGGIVATTNYAAILVISNCYNAGEIKSQSGNFAGGIVAKMYGTSSSRYSKVINCANIGKVSAAGKYVGGLVGACAGSVIYNSYNLGAVSSDSSNVGGLVGIHEAYNSYDSVMKNCYTSASVSGSSNVGLAVGTCDGATITSCYYDSSKSTTLSAIGINNDSQSVTAYSLLSTLLSSLNSGISSITDAVTWVAGSDSYPTFSFLITE